MKKVRIYAGTKVNVCKLADQSRRWQAHITTETVDGEVIDGRTGAVVVQVGSWLILAKQGQVGAIPKQSKEQRQTELWSESQRKYGLPSTVEKIESGERGTEEPFRLT